MSKKKINDAKRLEFESSLRAQFDAHSPAQMRIKEKLAKQEIKRLQNWLVSAKGMAAPPSQEEISQAKRLAGRASVGKKGSRKPDSRPVQVNIELLASLRKSRSFEAFARKLRMPRTTYQHIEKSGKTTLGTAKEIADRLDIDSQTLVIS